jgi:hypothetical protein
MNNLAIHLMPIHVTPRPDFFERDPLRSDGRFHVDAAKLPKPRTPRQPNRYFAKR